MSADAAAAGIRKTKGSASSAFLCVAGGFTEALFEATEVDASFATVSLCLRELRWVVYALTEANNLLRRGVAINVSVYQYI